jgi:hypothetical protein
LPENPPWFEIFGTNEKQIENVCSRLLQLYTIGRPSKSNLDERLVTLRRQLEAEKQRIKSCRDDAGVKPPNGHEAIDDTIFVRDKRVAVDCKLTELAACTTLATKQDSNHEIGVSQESEFHAPSSIKSKTNAYNERDEENGNGRLTSNEKTVVPTYHPSSSSHHHPHHPHHPHHQHSSRESSSRSYMESSSKRTTGSSSSRDRHKYRRSDSRDRDDSRDHRRNRDKEREHSLDSSDRKRHRKHHKH